MEEQNKGRVRTEIGRTYRRGVGTQKNVGAKTYGSRQSNQSTVRKASSLSSCTQRLLGAYGHAGYIEVNMNT